MTTTTTLATDCRAENPSTCRFHGPAILMNAAIARGDYEAYAIEREKLQRANQDAQPFNDLGENYKRPLFESASVFPNGTGEDYKKIVKDLSIGLTNELLDRNWRKAEKTLTRLRKGNGTLVKKSRGTIPADDPALNEINNAVDSLLAKVKAGSARATSPEVFRISRAVEEIASRD